MDMVMVRSTRNRAWTWGWDTFEAGKEKEKGKKRFRQGICMEMDGWMTSSKGKGDI
jgi:hypothetical protein